MADIATDGAATANAQAAGSVTAALTTTQPGDLILARLISNALGIGTPTISGGGLTWILRVDTDSLLSGSRRITYWYAIAPAALNAAQITASQSGAANLTLDVIAVTGYNTSSPFDSGAYGSSPSQPVPFVVFTGNPPSGLTSPLTTANADDMVVAFTSTSADVVITPPSGFTAVTGNEGGSAPGPCTQVAQLTVETLLDNYTVGFGYSGGSAGELLLDAIQAAPVIPPTPPSLPTIPPTYGQEITQPCAQGSPATLATPAATPQQETLPSGAALETQPVTRVYNRCLGAYTTPSGEILPD